MLVLILIITIFLIPLNTAHAKKHSSSFCQINPSACLQAKNNDYIKLAKATKKKRYSSTTFVFDPKRLRWYAYRNGVLVNSGRASGGKGYCRDVRRSCLTPRGVFRVYSKGSPSCRSSKFPLGRGGAPMPYCMFFRKGYAIHGSPNVPGYNASHGCIRVLPSAARWLHNNFIRIGTKVIVKPY